MKKIFLDTRELEYPKPLEKAIPILRELDNDSYLYMLHRREPVPLLALASEYKLNAISKEIDGQWHILISKNRDISLETLINKG